MPEPGVGSEAGAAELARLVEVDDRLDRVAEVVRSVGGPVEDLSGAVASVHVALRELQAEMAAQREVLDRLARQVAELSAGVGLARRMDEARERLEHAVDAAVSVEHSLAAHLEDRDRRLRHEREELARAFADQLAEGVGRRDLRRLARHVDTPLEVEVVPGHAPTPPRAPSAPPDATTGTTDPLRRALAGVRGLGPARQAALADHFGTVEALRAAADEEVLAVAGVAPALLPGIRSAVT